MTDIYAGMIRMPRKPGGGQGSQYQTFRTISTKVSTGWLHPGIEARHFAIEVGQYVQRILPARVRQMVRAALGEQTAAEGGTAP